MPRETPGNASGDTPGEGSSEFVQQGHFVALPLSFPSVSAPIAPEESLITALAVAPGGVLYGGTSGRRAHLFQACLKPSSGYILDMGCVEEARQTAQVVWSGEELLGCLNGPKGARIVAQTPPPVQDGIQEWSLGRCAPGRTVAEFPGETIHDAGLAPAGRELLCLTERRVLRLDLKSGDAAPLNGGERREPAVRALGVLPDGSVIATCRGGALSRLRPGASGFEETGVRLPFERDGWGWARAPDGRLLAADGDGSLFAVDLSRDSGRVDSLGRAPLAPVKCLACLPDGRAYGFCGTGIGRFFLLDLLAREVTDLGAVAGVLGVKRYAYRFCRALSGSGGEIYFGEDDRGGHLWMYFPPLRAALPAP